MSQPTYYTFQVPEEQATMLEAMFRDGVQQDGGYVQGVDILLNQDANGMTYSMNFKENAKIVLRHPPNDLGETKTELSILPQLCKSDLMVNIVTKTQQNQPENQQLIYESVTNKFRKTIFE